MPGAPGGQGGQQHQNSNNNVWDGTEIKLSGKQVIVTLPPVKVISDVDASVLDIFGAMAQAGFTRSTTGTPIFPGPLRRLREAVGSLQQREGSLPIGTVANDKLPRPIQRISWHAQLLPYLGKQELYDQINFSETWTFEKNRPVAFTLVDAFLDPNVPNRRWKGLPYEGLALTHFVGMAGIGEEAARLPKEDPRAGIFGYTRKAALADIRDGAGNTIMLIQVRDTFGPWMQGGGGTVRGAQVQPYIGGFGSFGTPGRDGVVAMFADGSVRFLSKDIDPKVFEALCTMGGGETVDLQSIAPPLKAVAINVPSAAAPAAAAPPASGENKPQN